MMGRPYREIFKKKASSDTASLVGEEADDDGMGESVASVSFKDVGQDSPDGQRVANPRINPDETWQLQTSEKLVRQMISLVSAHYPGMYYLRQVCKSTRSSTDVNLASRTIVPGSGSC